jgi:hypothetical protein
MSLKSAWKKFTKFFTVTPPVNSMMASDVAYIQEKISAQTAFKVACMDTRLVNGRRNVGLVMDPSTPADEVTKAQDLFIAAAKERNIELTRDQVIRYVPGGEPHVSRLVQPAPKTW